MTNKNKDEKNSLNAMKSRDSAKSASTAETVMLNDNHLLKQNLHKAIVGNDHENNTSASNMKESSTSSKALHAKGKNQFNISGLTNEKSNNSVVKLENSRYEEKKYDL